MDRQEDIKLHQELIVRAVPYELVFKKPARTSRDVMVTRPCWRVEVSHPAFPYTGIGECAPLFGLSVETRETLEKAILELVNEPAKVLDDRFRSVNSALVMAMETALGSLRAVAPWMPFMSEPHASLPINGLVWMSPADDMEEEAMMKAAAGFTCIKFKIGSLNLEDELRILKKLRAKYPADRMIIRVDANGAFGYDEAMRVLEALAAIQVHSMEQPVRPGHWQKTGKLVANSPVPIALDEELIGLHEPALRAQMMEEIKPHFLILKPGLHGGFESCEDWIARAGASGAGWWATSTLESNIGLNAIAQWTLNHHPQMHQGLGTGSLFVRNTHPFWHTQAGVLQFDGKHVPHDWYLLT
jgi:O-succinylbenzoate synthase